MEEGRNLVPWIVFVVVLGLLIGGVILWSGSPPPKEALDGLVQQPHPLFGKWSNEKLGSLILYRDQTASINGIKVPWVAADETAIRLELSLKKIWANLPDLVVMADFRPTPGAGGQAILNLAGQDFIFQRTDSAPSSPGNPGSGKL